MTLLVYLPTKMTKSDEQLTLQQLILLPILLVFTINVALGGLLPRLLVARIRNL